MTNQLLAFVGVCILITLVPGLDTALVTRNVVARGWRAGIMTALGTSSGLFHPCRGRRARRLSHPATLGRSL